MGAEIDSLEIKLQANAQSANRSLDALVKKLDVLSASLGKVNGNSLISLSSGVQGLASSMQSMKAVEAEDFKRLANNISKIGKVDSAGLNAAASSLRHFSSSLAKLDAIKVSDNAAQIGVLANGIKQLGYKSATQAIENIPKLAAAMKQLMTTLSGAPKVSQNIIDMTNALAKLARTGASSGRAATSLGKALDTYTISTGRARKGTFSLASAIGKLYAGYWLLFRTFGKIGDAINISSDLTEVQNVVDVTFGKYASLVEKMSETSIVDFGMSELTVKQVASRFQAMGTAMGFTQGKMADMSVQLTKLTADMASFYNAKQNAVAEDLSAIFTGETRPLRTYGLDLTQATLAEWAMKNGLDANIQSMSQAEKTMLRYQYVLANTTAAQGDFVRTADTWANQTRILKQNFQQLASVIGGVFINALKPLVKALNAAMSHIIAFAETISNALGKIFGWKFEKGGGGGITNDFEDAAGSAGDIADATGQAAKNIEKIQKGIRSFDELKNITLPDASNSGNSGSGAGGGASSGGGASGGQWTEVESIFDTFESEIDSLYELGEYIGKTLTKAMNDIDWNSIYQGAKNFGKGLAEFLNGLISPELFGAVGRTVASGLNTAIYAALSFGTTFDWKDFGLSIAEGINEFFRTFDFKALAQTINAWVQGVWTTIKTTIKNIDWKAVWDGAKEFLSEIDIETVEILLGAFVLKLAGKLLTGAALKKALEKIITGKFVAAFGSEAAKSAFSYAIPISLSLVVGVLSFTVGKDLIKQGAENLVKAYEEGGFLEYLKECFKQLLNPFTWINIGGGGILSAGAVGEKLATDSREKIESGEESGLGYSSKFSLKDWINEWLYINGSDLRIGDGAEGTPFSKETWTKVCDDIISVLQTKSPELQAETIKMISCIESGVQLKEEELSMLFSNLGIKLPDELAKSLLGKEPAVQVSTINLLSKLETGEQLKRDELIAVFNSLGIDVADDGLIQALSCEESEVQQSAIELLLQLKNASDEKRTYLIGELKKLGIDVAKDGYIYGIDSQQTNSKTAGVNLSNSSVQGIASANGSTEASKLGVAFGQGYVNGIMSQIQAVSLAAAQLVMAGVSSVQTTQDSHSPSKVAKGLGGDFSEGYELGIVDNEKSTITTAEKWISSVIGKISKFSAPTLDIKVNRPQMPSFSFDDVSSAINLGSYKADIRGSISAELGGRIDSYVDEIRRQNRLMEEQNALLRDIREKPIIQDSDVFDSFRRAQRTYNGSTGKVGLAGVD